MGQVASFAAVKLFCGIIYREDSERDRARHLLQVNLSAIERDTAPIPFTTTDYYFPEMGQPLWRQFVAFRQTIDPAILADVKLMTNRIEFDLAHQGGGRTVNLDPGYLSSGNVVIATTKNYFHRIPLKNGIYAHLEYVIKKRRLTPLEWTYPDFKSMAYMDFFVGLLGDFTKKMSRQR